MGGSDKRVLVVFATRSGCTEGIAERIGETLVNLGLDVDVVPADQAGDPSGYDAVIVGSGVRAGLWHGSAKSWIAKHQETLRTLPVAMFTCGLMVLQGEDKAAEVRAYTDQIISASGLEPLDVGLFAGWNEPDSFSMPERVVMKLMKTPRGDFRDSAAIAAWTEQAAQQF